MFLIRQFVIITRYINNVTTVVVMCYYFAIIGILYPSIKHYYDYFYYILNNLLNYSTQLCIIFANNYPRVDVNVFSKNGVLLVYKKMLYLHHKKCFIPTTKRQK